MKKGSTSQSAFFNPRVFLGLVLCAAGTFFAAQSFAQPPKSGKSAPRGQSVPMHFGKSYHHDVSPPLRDLALLPVRKSERQEDNENPKLPNHHVNSKDPVAQHLHLRGQMPNMPATILNFEGIPYPGGACGCSPPDTNGAVGATQYVQMVNEGYQVFAKSTGASVLGPNSIVSLWTGFGGACEAGGAGDPVVIYDHLANRWVITQFASVDGNMPFQDECIAVSTTSDATGTYARYGFHITSNFIDYPKIAVWPDAYYMSFNLFDNSAGTPYLGPQAFAFDRNAMIAGTTATFVNSAIIGSGSEDPFLPADLDGSNLPPTGTPETYVAFPGSGVYKVWHFHVDFVTPANSTFTLFASPAAAGFTTLCDSTRSCVPQPDTAVGLDGIGDRLMFRLPYRKFGDGHESVVGNYTVDSGGVAGVRWFELQNVSSGPVTVAQESTYQPDATWRWMGSVAMDADGNMALGFSASSASVYPGIRYAGRLATDPPSTLAQGETTLVAGSGSQTSEKDRWGDYSSMSVDPVDDHTFWYTNEYYTATAYVDWKTRIASFKFVAAAPQILNGPPPSPVIVGAPYSFTFAASGNPTPTYSLSGTLPPGLSFSSAGVLSGTCTDGGTGSFPGITVTATNAVAPDAMQTFTLNTATRANNYIASFGLTGTDAVLTNDYDHDGIPNLMEYALGLDPTVNSLAGLPTVTLKNYSGTTYLSMLFHRSSLATDLTYIVQVSGDLVSWTNVGTSSAGGMTSGTGFVTETGSPPNFTVEVRDTVPYDPMSPTKRFMRLMVTSP